MQFESTQMGICDSYEHKHQFHTEQGTCHNFELLYKNKKLPVYQPNQRAYVEMSVEFSCVMETETDKYNFMSFIHKTAKEYMRVFKDAQPAVEYATPKVAVLLEDQ